MLHSTPRRLNDPETLEPLGTGWSDSLTPKRQVLTARFIEPRTTHRLQGQEMLWVVLHHGSLPMIEHSSGDCQQSAMYVWECRANIFRHIPRSVRTAKQYQNNFGSADDCGSGMSTPSATPPRPYEASSTLTCSLPCYSGRPDSQYRRSFRQSHLSRIGKLPQIECEIIIMDWFRRLQTFAVDCSRATPGRRKTYSYRLKSMGNLHHRTATVAVALDWPLSLKGARLIGSAPGAYVLVEPQGVSEHLKPRVCVRTSEKLNSSLAIMQGFPESAGLRLAFKL
ncbi:hypothetical protein BDV06DRAFT_21845 [Aspergillus oleicola]